MEIHEMITKMKNTNWENQKRGKEIKERLEFHIDKIVEEMIEHTDKSINSEELKVDYDLEVTPKGIFLGLYCVDGYSKLTSSQIESINKLVTGSETSKFSIYSQNMGNICLEW